MIAPAFLRIGNILTVCYEEGFKPYTVEILQSDLVHLSNRPEADDPRDIIGLPVTQEFLVSVNFKKLSTLYIAHFNENLISVELAAEIDFTCLYIDQTRFPIKYIHELQNIVFFTTGWEIIPSFKNTTPSL